MKVTARLVRIWIRNCSTYYILYDIRRTLNKRLQFLKQEKNIGVSPFSKIPIKKKREIMSKLLVNTLNVKSEKNEEANK